MFVEITDDSVYCGPYNQFGGAAAAANAFDAALRALSSKQFGTDQDRNYVWHSIVGLDNGSGPSGASLPGDPIINTACPTAVDAGQGYQQLSIMTGGLRFPICNLSSYDVVFREIAKGVVEGSPVACNFPVPQAPSGKTIDRKTVVVAYTPGAATGDGAGVGGAAGAGGSGPGGGAQVTSFEQVDTFAECAPDKFYIFHNQITLCPDTCSAIQKDAGAKVDVLYGCDTIVH